LAALLGRMAFEVAAWLGIPEREALAYPASALVERYEWTAEAQWNRTLEDISAVEIGTMRALAKAFGGKEKLPELPTYDEVLRKGEREHRLPEWMERFERANVDRAKRTAT
jgi:hypothetical protein